MKKNIYLLLMMIVVVSNISGCSDVNRNTDSEIGSKVESEVEFEVQAFTFEEIVENSNVTLYGQYIESYEHEYYVEHKFKVNEVLYGTVSEAEIYLYADKGTAHIVEEGYFYEMDADIYEKNKEYILILEKRESILYDHDRYLNIGDLLLCETDKEYRLYSEVVEIPSGLTLEEYVLSTKNLADIQEETGLTDFISGNEDEWIESSKYIGKVKILELYVEGKVHNGNTYKCKVESLLKGTDLNMFSDETILLTILKDTVDIGGTYMIGFSPASENSLIYAQTSVDGVLEFSNDLWNDVLERMD